MSNQDENAAVHCDSKSFGAQASKFQTQPNKLKNKVIIVDEEEEKEFGVSTSINNHISLGSIQDQEQRLLQMQQNLMPNGTGINLHLYEAQMKQMKDNEALDRIRSAMYMPPMGN